MSYEFIAFNKIRETIIRLAPTMKKSADTPMNWSFVRFCEIKYIVMGGPKKLDRPPMKPAIKPARGFIPNRKLEGIFKLSLNLDKNTKATIIKPRILVNTFLSTMLINPTPEIVPTGSHTKRDQNFLRPRDR